MRPGARISLNFFRCWRRQSIDSRGRDESQSAVILGLEHDDAGFLRRCAEAIAQYGLNRYFDFYNSRRIRQSHEYQTADDIYCATNATGEPLAIAA